MVRFSHAGLLVTMLSKEPNMLRHHRMLACISLVCPWILACSPMFSQSEVRVAQLKEDAFTLDIIDNSPTFSHSLDINKKGQMIGVREVADQAGHVYSQESFFIDGSETIKLPLLEGFTSIEILALSDTGRVVGYASRPIGHPEGSLTGIVWDSATKKLTRLPPIAGDLACHAQDISADGRQITGYSSGFSPARLRPCVWSWQEDSQSWVAEGLPVIQDYNPYTMSSSVIISPDGQRVAACITVEELPNNQFDSSLFVWELENEHWIRKPVSDKQMFLRGMNNSGQIVGIYTSELRRGPCLIDLKGELTQIDLLPGDDSGEARGINAAGTVVGFSDDPTGPEGGPQAFVWHNGKTSPLDLPPNTEFSAAFGINDNGQIAGMLDTVIAGGQKSETSVNGPEPLVKTLAFRWSPAKPR